MSVLYRHYYNVTIMQSPGLANLVYSSQKSYGALDSIRECSREIISCKHTIAVRFRAKSTNEPAAGCNRQQTLNGGPMVQATLAELTVQPVQIGTCTDSVDERNLETVTNRGFHVDMMH